jgi:hypothetical protein
MYGAPCGAPFCMVRRHEDAALIRGDAEPIEFAGRIAGRFLAELLAILLVVRPASPQTVRRNNVRYPT